ncbi:MAG: hypothetical protein ACK44T_11020 [Sphingomonadales bacterium]
MSMLPIRLFPSKHPTVPDQPCFLLKTATLIISDNAARNQTIQIPTIYAIGNTANTHKGLHAFYSSLVARPHTMYTVNCVKKRKFIHLLVIVVAILSNIGPFHKPSQNGCNVGC